MNRQIVMTLALIAALPGGTVAMAQEQAAPSNGTQERVQSSAPAGPLWLMSCSNQMRPEQLMCEFSQSIVLTQGNQSQRVATASFNRVFGESETNAVFTLPYGVSLPDSVKILVDDEEVGSLEWQSCDLGGCYASAPVDDSWLEAMREGDNMTAALKGRDGRDLSFSFQLNGFTEAEEIMP